MRITKNLFFLLLAGILSPSIAQRSNLTRKGLVLSVLEIIKNSESVNYNSSEDKNEAINKVLKESCEKNGGKSAYIVAKESWDHYQNCNRSANQMTSNITTHQARGDAVRVIHETCTHVPNMKDCIKRLRNSIKPCLEPEEHELVNVFFDVMNSMLQFACDIDGEPIKKYATEGGPECFRSKRVLLLSCFAEVPTLHHLTDSSQELISVGIEGLYTYLPSAKSCSEINKFQACSEGVLKGCTSPTSAEMLGRFFNKMKPAMNCETSSNSHAASTSFANCILITAVMAILNYFA